MKKYTQFMQHLKVYVTIVFVDPSKGIGYETRNMDKNEIRKTTTILSYYQNDVYEIKYMFWLFSTVHKNFCFRS